MADSGKERVFRGGSWSFMACYCQVASRGRYIPGVRYSFLGFRLLTETSPERVVRGGSWLSGKRCCQCAYRHRLNADYRCDYLGFRLMINSK